MLLKIQGMGDAPTPTDAICHKFSGSPFLEFLFDRLFSARLTQPTFNLRDCFASKALNLGAEFRLMKLSGFVLRILEKPIV